MRSILVTGGAGFIGSHLADELLRLGHRVAIVDNLSMGKKENVPPGASFYEQDIRDSALGAVFKKEKPEIVFHFAAQASVARSLEDPLGDAEVNVLGSLRVFEEARRLGAKKFVFASTGGAMYGEEGRLPAVEQDEPRPRSPYAVSKLAVERYLEVLAPLSGMQYAALRFANVYGPRQDPHGEAGGIAIFTGRMRRGDQPVIHGDGEQTRDFLYVADAVQASIVALKTEAQGVYHIGSGRETSINEIFASMKALTGSSCAEVHDEARPGEQQRSCLDASRAQRELGWAPVVSLQEGLRNTVKWFDNRSS